MATELTQTAANVVAGTGAQIKQGIASDTITAGNPVYRHTDGTFKRTVASTLLGAAAHGIALNGASSGQPIDYCTAGNINIGATLTVGQTYSVGASTGKIELLPTAEPSTYMTKLGIATTTSNLVLDIYVSGVAIPA